MKHILLTFLALAWSVAASEIQTGGSAAGTNNQAPVYIRGGYQTNTSNPILELTETWNNSGTAFKGMRVVVTNTASASGSRPFEVYGGASGATRLMDVDPNGGLYAAYTINTGNDITSGANVIAGTSSSITWSTRTRMYSAEDGGLRICNEQRTVDRFRAAGSPKVLTDGVATLVFTNSFATNTIIGEQIFYTVMCKTGTADYDQQVQTGTLQIAALSKDGIAPIINLTDSTNLLAATSGTLACTWSAAVTSTNTLGIYLLADTSLTPAANSLTVTYTVLNQSSQVVIPQ